MYTVYRDVQRRVIYLSPINIGPAIYCRTGQTNYYDVCVCACVSVCVCVP